MPRSWCSRIRMFTCPLAGMNCCAPALPRWRRRDPDWALLGAFGVGLDGAHIGPVWSSSLGMIVGRVPMAPVPVQSYDEMVIVLRRASGIRFDDGLPGWHMYGTDIVQTAPRRGKKAYAVGSALYSQ